MASKTSKRIFHDKNPSGTPIVKEDLKLPKCFSSKLAFMLYNVFSKEECEEFIKHTKKLGYEEALVNIGFGRQKKMTDVRNNDRCIWDTFEESGKMFDRIKPYLPPVWNHRKLMGLNERLRVLFYRPGQYFKPHFDGEYRRTNGERSYVTIQVYLNEGFEGGETTFMDSPDKELCPVVPKTGSVLVFQHDILHEGSMLKAGEKFTIRTDVMYSGAQIEPEEESAIVAAHKALLNTPDEAANTSEDEQIQSCGDRIKKLDLNCSEPMASKTPRRIFLDKHPSGLSVVKKEVKLPNCSSSKLAFMLYNVFSKEECDEFIKHTKTLEYHEALVDVGVGKQRKMPEVRNNKRCVWNTFEEAEQIFNRIKLYLPPVWNHRKLIGLNEKFRILYYQPGEYFKPHFDGDYRRTNGERSYFSVQVYLNEGFTGGETTFLESPEHDLCPVIPKAGSVLVFEHELLHEGSTLLSGEKFTLRTDAMYSGSQIDPEEESVIGETHKFLLRKPENTTEDEKFQSNSDRINNPDIQTESSAKSMVPKMSKTIFHDKQPLGTSVVKEDLKIPKCFSSKLAFMLYNVFSQEECEEVIKHTKKLGYEEALINIGFGRQKKMTDIRNSDRCIWDTFEESGKIFDRIKPYLPPVWNHRKLIGLNERLRVLLYQPGQYFKPHFDGEYRRRNGERSYVTIHVYLNEGFEGGETTFMDSHKKELCPVVPKTGSVLVFQHDILHEGSTLRAGEKFAIRTDVMYSGAHIKPDEENAILEAHGSLLGKPCNVVNTTDEHKSSCVIG